MTDSTSLTPQQLLQSLHNLSLPEDAALKMIELKQDEILFHQGDEADSIYLLVAGGLGVRVRQADGTEAVIDKLAPGAVVGELALLSGQARTATVFAINDAGLLEINRAQYESIASEQALDDVVVARWRRLQLATVLGNLFGELDASTLNMLQERLAWQHLSNGDILFRQGDASDGMYIVVNGRIRFTVTNEEGQIIASNEVSSGETIGEYTLIVAGKRTATAHAIRETNVVKLTPTQFEQMRASYPQLMNHLTRIIVERQQRGLQQNKPLAPSKLTITILPLSSQVDAFQFAQELAAVMRPFGSATALDAAQFNARAKSPTAAETAVTAPNNPAIVALTDELEANDNFLLYAADREGTAWTQRCLGQADRVLLLASPAEAPADTGAIQLLNQFEIPLRTELVLWHPPQTEQPMGTAVWLDKFPTLHTFHHIRQGDTNHMQRLGRRLTGHAIGLVLSGGAARGFAHLGVHRALEELNIPIDYIGATSMGAVIGASIITSKDNTDMMRKSATSADPKMLFDRTLPLTSLMASQKVTRFTRQAFGDNLIEDQWIPFFCVASNLNTAEAVIYQRGPLWRAVRSSLAIPGVFTPVMQDGDVIVDGAVIDNFPALTMANLCESDRIIGVNVSPLREKKRSYDYETHISGWRILLSRLNPFGKPLRAPSLMGTILRTFEINSARRAKEEEAVVDIMIYPEVKNFKTTDYHKYKEISQVGYEAAFGPLSKWKEERLETV